MKPIFRFLFVCLLFLAIESSPAQIAADYYLPLRVGNYLRFHTQGNLTGWEARTSRHSIDGSNSISGQIYFREQGMETPDNNPLNINIFHVFWLRKDSAGDLLIGAMSISSSNVDSATLFNPPGGYFTHQSLV